MLFLVLLFSHSTILGIGYWMHWKFGARVAADLEKVRQLKP